MVEIVTGFSGTRTSTTKIWNNPLAHFSAFASSATTARLRPGSGSGGGVPPGNGGDQMMRGRGFGFVRSLMSGIVNAPLRHAPYPLSPATIQLLRVTRFPGASVEC